MKKELIESLAWAGTLIGLTIGAIFAHKVGYIDLDTLIRLTSGPVGLWMAWYGNRMPKTLVPVPANARQARRVASWSLVLSGLVLPDCGRSRRCRWRSGAGQERSWRGWR